MISVLSQLHAAAQIDSDQWINFLILAVMAILWLFGALIKAATKKKPSEGQQGGLAQAQRETWQVRLARKAEELQRAIEGQSTDASERIRRRAEQRTGAQKRAQALPPGKITVQSGRRGESVVVYEKAEPAADSTRERHAARQREAKEAVSAAGRKAMMSPVEPRLETVEQPASKPVAEELADVTLHLPQPPTEGVQTQPAAVTGYEPASIIDYSDPDALKKAVLLYEILGKPVGLRDPAEQSTAF